jgi:hypothetical protein
VLNLNLTVNCTQGAHELRQPHSFQSGEAHTPGTAQQCDGYTSRGRKQRTTNRQNLTPGFAQAIVTGRSSGLPSSSFEPAFPCRAQWRSIKFVRHTAAGAAPDWREMKISCVTGFPFHPPADKQEGTIHVISNILPALGIILTKYRVFGA